jgi:hypothetical protein
MGALTRVWCMAQTDSRTALIVALRSERYDTARRLLAADGIDANVYDKMGDCALWLALEANQVSACPACERERERVR